MRRMKRGSSIGAQRPLKDDVGGNPRSGAYDDHGQAVHGSIIDADRAAEMFLRSMFRQREACSAVSTPFRTTTKLRRRCSDVERRRTRGEDAVSPAAVE